MISLIAGFFVVFISVFSPTNQGFVTTEVKKEKYAHYINAKDSIASFHRNNNIPEISAQREIKIAVIDQGINTDIENIEDYIYNPLNIKDFVGYDLTKTSLKDNSEHGTSVIGIILGVNPNVKILPIKYDHPYSRETDAESIKKELHALKIAIESDVDIIHMSISGTGRNKEEERLFKLAQEKGILIITAMGNEGLNLDASDKRYPASYNFDNQISVSNYDMKNNTISKNSNYAFSLDTISYNGVRVKSFNTIKSGTSQAAPFITGAVSLILANNPKLSAKAIKSILDECSDKGLHFQSKYGLFNFEKLAEKLQSKELHIAQN